MLPADFWANEQGFLRQLILPLLSKYAMEGVENALKQIVGIGLGFDPALGNAKAAQWARQHTDDLLNLLGTTNQRVVGDVIANWIEAQGTMGQLTEQLQRVLDANESRAAMIATTEVTRAYAEGEKIVYDEAGVKEWRWQTNRDELVCPICRPLNNKVKRIGEPFSSFRAQPITKPPAHPNCRCWVSPVAKGIT